MSNFSHQRLLVRLPFARYHHIGFGQQLVKARQVQYNVNTWTQLRLQIGQQCITQAPCRTCTWVMSQFWNSHTSLLRTTSKEPQLPIQFLHLLRSCSLLRRKDIGRALWAVERIIHITGHHQSALLLFPSTHV